MDNWGLLELYLRARADERLQWRAEPEAPQTQSHRRFWRRWLAQELIGIGLRLDADTAGAVLRTETRAQLNGSDA